MSFYYSFLGRSEICFLSASDHDYPCGPAKKLYGYDNNDPVQIILSPTADAVVARFEHDVLLTSNVPIPWRRAGDVDVATFDRDPNRAVFFAQDPDNPGPHDPDLDLLDEDSRDFAPMLVLGPDAAMRYAIDLRYCVHSIVRTGADSDDVELNYVGGPHGGYAIYDCKHNLVRRGEGELRGGWFRFATIEHAGHYWREDLATGERTLLGSADLAFATDPDVEAIALDADREGRHELAAQIRATNPSTPVECAARLDALAISGTRNILLIADRHLRVV